MVKAQNTIIGNERARGVSGGERRVSNPLGRRTPSPTQPNSQHFFLFSLTRQRVMIAVELISGPSVMFLDGTCVEALGGCVCPAFHFEFPTPTHRAHQWSRQLPSPVRGLGPQNAGRGGADHCHGHPPAAVVHLPGRSVRLGLYLWQTFFSHTHPTFISPPRCLTGCTSCRTAKPFILETRATRYSTLRRLGGCARRCGTPPTFCWT